MTANGQRLREITEDTLFLQNWTGVLKVRVTVASFPVVAAPPATGSAPQPFRQVWEEHSAAGDGVGTQCGRGKVEEEPQEPGWRGEGEKTGQASVSATPPQNKKATRPMKKKRENEN